MNDNSGQIIQLLTELRDMQREESAYRRKVMEESISLSRRGVRMQRRGLLFVVSVVIVGAIVVAAAVMNRP